MTKKKGVQDGKQAKTQALAKVPVENSQPPAIEIPCIPAAEIDRQSALAGQLARAGSLSLTKDEQEHLRRPFDAGYIKVRRLKGRDEAYIPHIEISRRLSDALGVGQWCIVRLREWISEDGKQVYGSYAMVVRGVWVGDTVAGWPYYATNPSVDYADCLECTRGVALRRIAAKSLGCGDSCWEGEQDPNLHDQPPPPPPPPPKQRPGESHDKKLRETALANTLESLHAMSRQGAFHLKMLWGAIGKEMRIAFAGELSALKEVAERADKEFLEKQAGMQS